MDEDTADSNQEFNYARLASMIEEIGKLGRNGREAFTDYLKESGRDGDTYMEEGFLQLADVSTDCYE